MSPYQEVTNTDSPNSGKNKWNANQEELYTRVGSLEAGSADKHYVHEQATASAEWVVTHNLGKFPSVSVADSAGSVVEGDVTYLNENEIRLNFSALFSGSVYLN